jgi:hypothetical protein
MKFSFVMMGIFVDELLVTGNAVEEIAIVQEKMRSEFVLTDQREPILFGRRSVLGR